MSGLHAPLVSIPAVWPQTMARGVAVVGFMLCIWAPCVAVVSSPPFLTAAHTAIKEPARFSTQVEIIRRATPLWTGMVNLYNTMLYRAGVSGNPQVAVIGKNGWVYLGDYHGGSFSQSIRRQVLTDEQVTTWVDTLRLQRAWLARRGIQLFYLMAPSPSSIYPEFLPDWTRPLLDRPTSFDKILAAGRDLPIIDARPALVRERKTADTYSKLSTHWTEFGAWVAWQETAPRLASALPGFQPFGMHGLAGVEPSPECPNEYRNMAGIAGCDMRNHPRLKQQWPEFQVTAGTGARPEKYPGDTMIMYAPSLAETLNTSASNRMTLLYLRDSMGLAPAPYLQASFYKTVQLHYLFSHHAVPDLVEKYKPAAVLYVVTERMVEYIGEHYYWYSLNEFDTAPPGCDLTWTPNGREGLDVNTVGNTFARPVAISWENEPRSARAGVFKIRFSFPGDAKEIAVLRLDFKIDGHPKSRDMLFDGGANELYAYIPAGVDGDKVTATIISPWGSLVALESVALRLK
jgi:hypothetical protein